ncbi:hypothetical protein WKH16_22470 [Pantoea agglomerans]|uniref:hypothetical protein n=1 Tax=Enterobacter agglomerans TaxID=549 RepID=UPI003C7ED38C
MTKEELQQILAANNQMMVGTFNTMLAQQNQQFEQLLNQAKTVFYTQGYNDGSAHGYVTAVDALKPAISDGLRNGSSECGKVMQSLRSLGLDDSDE